MFTCWVRIVLKYRYKIIWVSSNPTYLIKRVKPFNSNLINFVINSYRICKLYKKLSALTWTKHETDSRKNNNNKASVGLNPIVLQSQLPINVIILFATKSKSAKYSALINDYPQSRSPNRRSWKKESYLIEDWKMPTKQSFFWCLLF